jgi:predicted  nucleic acid-binding Zn-ribbon protein
MADEKQSALEIKETDIVFDCPHCGKSLAIDYRGAGLSVPCTDCGKYVPVPIPEGMELTDIDSTEEEQEVRILGLRRALAGAQFRIRELESEVAELRDRRASLEKDRAERMMRMGSILGKVGMIQEAVRRLNEAIEQISAAASGNAGGTGA